MEFRFPFRFGVYEVNNKLNQHRYIGSAGGRTIRQRLMDHIRHLRRNTHCNAYLQAAFNLYGEDSFEFKPLLYCDKDQVLLYEQAMIDGLKPEYNLCPTAGNSTGYKHTLASKIKMSELKRGVYAGSNHPRSKLNEDDVRQIKRFLKSGLGNTAIAHMFDVNNRTVSNIRQGISWKHVE